jgi:hypothetical protein
MQSTKFGILSKKFILFWNLLTEKVGEWTQYFMGSPVVSDAPDSSGLTCAPFFFGQLKIFLAASRVSIYFVFQSTFKSFYMITSNKRLGGILSAAALLLLVPFIAMQFSAEVNWSASDFIIAAVLLFGTGLLCELVLRKVKTFKLRIIICAALLVVLFLVWAELAVGLFGTPFAGS